jgi:hypothetical protein
MALTESVSSFQAPATPGTAACPPSFPSVPTSSGRGLVQKRANDAGPTSVLMASLSCRISPTTSMVILRERLPLATAVATSAMFRTWPVKMPAIELTESVAPHCHSAIGSYSKDGLPELHFYHFYFWRDRTKTPPSVSFTRALLPSGKSEDRCRSIGLAWL